MYYAFNYRGLPIGQTATFEEATRLVGVQFIKFVPIGTTALPRKIPRNWSN